MLLKHPNQRRGLSRPGLSRRGLSAALVVVGGLLIFLAPENVWIGAVLAILGIVIELIAFGLVHRRNDRK